jgi:adenosylcobinamide-GDP ribazoletransferase
MRYRVPLSFRPLLLAVATLTALRTPPRGAATAEETRAATAFYPLVGLGVGAVPAAVLLLPLPPLPLATLALAAWVLATGALHLDGWARCCGAALAPAAADERATRERRLAILGDSRLGTFGGVGLALLLLAKWTGLVYAPAVAPLVAAPVARWAMVHALRSYPAARPDPAGAALAGGGRLWAATGLLMAVVLPLVGRSDDPLRLATAVILGVGASLAVSELLSRRFGGVTSETCGAAGEAAELAALWAFVPWGYA